MTGRRPEETSGALGIEIQTDNGNTLFLICVIHTSTINSGTVYRPFCMLTPAQTTLPTCDILTIDTTPLEI